MKHIKRRFSGHLHVDGLNQTLEKKIKFEEFETFQEAIPEGMKGLLFTDKDEMFYAFSFKDTFKGRECLVPEPDPILVYFNVAQINYRLIVTLNGRENLIELLSDLKKSETSKVMHSLYNFLAESSAFAIFLFMAMESAVNKAITDDFELRKIDSKKTVVYDNLQVQKLEFKEKVKDILPKITGRKFWNDHLTEWNFLIVDLKELRDEIVHTKKQLGTQTHYKEVYVRALNFDYARAIQYAKTFINYYHKDLVEECNCGVDF